MGSRLEDVLDDYLVANDDLDGRTKRAMAQRILRFDEWCSENDVQVTLGREGK